MNKKAMSEGGKKGGSKKNPNKGFGSLTPEQRKEQGRKAALIRWSKVKANQKSSPYTTNTTVLLKKSRKN